MDPHLGWMGIGEGKGEGKKFSHSHRVECLNVPFWSLELPDWIRWSDMGYMMDFQWHSLRQWPMTNDHANEDGQLE